MKVRRISVVCSKCGNEPLPNKKESNKNWVVVDNKLCSKCGGKLEFKLAKYEEKSK